MTDITDLEDLFGRAVDEQEPPTSGAYEQIIKTGRRYRRRHQLRFASAGIIVCAGIASIVVALVPKNTNQTVSTGGTSGGGGGVWRIGAAQLAVLHDYAQPSGQISAVTTVELKETTWANYLVWARSEADDAPLSAGYIGSGDHTKPIFSSSDAIDIVTQVGDFNYNTIYGCHGRSYKWVFNIIHVGDPPGGGLVWSAPVGASPPSLASIPGPDAILDTRTGHVTSTSSPPPGTPTVIVPSVVGQSILSAVTELQNLGFSALAPGQTMIALGPGPDRRRVTSQDPPAGIPAPDGSTVVLTFAG